MVKNKNKILWIVLIVIIAIIVAVLAMPKQGNGVSEMDKFAQCIKNSGAKFYGTFWCSHCQNQKKAFGTSARYLPYVECSTPNGQGQVAECKEAGITAYPAWKFADGSSEVGEVSFAKLAEKTKCPAPNTEK